MSLDTGITSESYVATASLCQPKGVFCSCWLLLRISWVQPDVQSPSAACSRTSWRHTFYAHGTRYRNLARAFPEQGAEIGPGDRRWWMVEFWGRLDIGSWVQRWSWSLAEKGSEKGGVPFLECRWGSHEARSHHCHCRHGFRCSGFM